MSKFSLFLTLIYVAVISSCSQPESVPQSNLRFDHILFFVDSDSLENLLYQELFNPAEKLTTIHQEQGTKGNYILFLNTYLEFLYPNDSAKIIENQPRFGSPYYQRWKDKKANPFSFGLILEPFDTSTLDFPFNQYQSPNMPKEEYYVMSGYNRNNQAPMVYISMPHRAHKSLNSLAEIDEKVEAFKREDVRKYLTHPSGIEKLTKVILSRPTTVEATQNFKIIRQLGNVEISTGDKHKLTLIFDKNRQGKTFTFEQEVSLEIKY